MPLAKVTGRAPNTKPCERCGKLVAYWWNGKYVVWARHNAPNKRPCRAVHAPRPEAEGKASR